MRPEPVTDLLAAIRETLSLPGAAEYAGLAVRDRTAEHRANGLAGVLEHLSALRCEWHADGGHRDLCLTSTTAAVRNVAVHYPVTYAVMPSAGDEEALS